jgi:hypothetical protein
MASTEELLLLDTLHRINWDTTFDEREKCRAEVALDEF